MFECRLDVGDEKYCGLRFGFAGHHHLTTLQNNTKPAFFGNLKFDIHFD